MSDSEFLTRFVAKVNTRGQERAEAPPSIEDWGRFQSIRDRIDEDKLLANVMRQIIRSSQEPMGPYLDVYLGSKNGDIVVDGRVDCLPLAEMQLVDRLWKEAQK